MHAQLASWESVQIRRSDVSSCWPSGKDLSFLASKIFACSVKNDKKVIEKQMPHRNVEIFFLFFWFAMWNQCIFLRAVYVAEKLRGEGKRNMHVIFQRRESAFFSPHYISVDREFIHLELTKWCQKATENNSSAKGLAVWMICSLCPESITVRWNFRV